MRLEDLIGVINPRAEDWLLKALVDEQLALMAAGFTVKYPNVLHGGR